MHRQQWYRITPYQVPFQGSKASWRSTRGVPHACWSEDASSEYSADSRDAHMECTRPRLNSHLVVDPTIQQRLARW
jgi:hypothetical protein